MKFLTTVLALTLTTTSAMAGEFNIGTGSENGGYHKKGQRVLHAIGAEQIKINQKLQKRKKDLVVFDLNTVVTNGSIENVEGFNDGTFQAVMTQIDALNTNKPAFKFKVRTTHSEPVLWLYNKAHGFKDLSSVEGKKEFAIVLVEGSGGEVTFRNFIAEDEDYGKHEIVYALDLEDALDIVAEGEYQGDESTVKVAGMIYVSNSLSAETARDYIKYVGVGEATDSDFNDAKDVEGNKLYVNCSFNPKAMGGLQATTWTKPDTVCVRSVFMWNTQQLTREEAKVVSKAARSVFAK